MYMVILQINQIASLRLVKVEVQVGTGLVHFWKLPVK